MNTTMTHKTFAADMTLAEGERSFIARITSDALDRDGEVLLPQGMDAKEFEDNPVVFFNHEHRAVPVGKVTSLRREADHWLAKVYLAMRPLTHVGEWLPDTLLSLIQQGVVRGVSVGAQAIETRRPTKKDKDTFGETIRNVLSKWKLIELSIAPIPANQEALILAVSKKFDKAAFKAEFDAAVAPQPRRAVLVYAKAFTVPAAPRVNVAALAAKMVGRELDKRRGIIYS